MHFPINTGQPLACTWWTADCAASHGALAEAATHLKDHPVVLLLPTEICSHHQVEVPVRSGRWRLQAVYSTLEESLLEDPQTLHLAFGPWQARRRCRLFALPGEWLKQCLAQLAEHGLTPVRIHVDSDCLGKEKPAALLCAGRWLISGADHLRLALAPQDADQLHAALPADLHWHDRDEQPWQRLSEGAEHAIDLRQGDFSLRAPVRPPWRGLGALAALAMIALLLHTVGQRWLIEHHSVRLASENQRAFIQRFPDETRIVDLRRQLQTRMRQTHAPAHNLARRLEQLAEHWSLSGGALAIIRHLDYHATEGWTLAVSAPTFADIERLRAGLAARGLNVQAEGTVRQPDGVSAQLRIKE
nr:type II secretion system protein GspL [Pseudomonas sp. R5(2019)]